MAELTVMVSSTQLDLQPERDCVDKIIRDYGFRTLRAETIGSRAHPSRTVCMEMARECDLYILVLGGRYGWLDDQTGRSITELEFEEARAADPTKILVYRKGGVTPDEGQAGFIARVEDFDTGYFRRPAFASLDELSAWVREDITHWVSDRARNRNHQEKDSRRNGAVALGAVTDARSRWTASFGQGPWVGVCMMPIGVQLGVDAYKLGDPGLGRKLSLMAFQSEPPLFDLHHGVQTDTTENTLKLWQEEYRQAPLAELVLTTWGLLTLRVGLDQRSDNRHHFARGLFADPAVAEALLAASLTLSAVVLKELGAPARMPLAIGASLGGMHMRNFAPIPQNANGGVTIPIFDSVPDPLHVPSEVEERSLADLKDRASGVAGQWVELMKRAYARKR